jgi:hypothetical protein
MQTIGKVDFSFFKLSYDIDGKKDMAGGLWLIRWDFERLEGKVK